MFYLYEDTYPDPTYDPPINVTDLLITDCITDVVGNRLLGIYSSHEAAKRARFEAV